MSKQRANVLSGKVWIGTSGIVLPGPKKTFPLSFQDKSRLHFYSSLFNSIEINSSFYTIPQNKTLQRWSADVLGNFCFTIKVWKGITHARDLQFKLADVNDFMQSIALPMAYRGCLLVQLPATISDVYIAEVLLLLNCISRYNTAGQWRICIEFRHGSWYNLDIFTTLANMDIAIVRHDKFLIEDITHFPEASFRYSRFHGPGGDYRGGYPEEYLKSIAEKAVQWNTAGKDIFMYFNNTIGEAFQNALFVQRMARQLSSI